MERPLVNERLVVEQHANIGISPRELPNKWEYGAPYAGRIPFPIGLWIGSRYGWLGVPVFFSGSLEFPPENMMCWV